MNFKKIKMKFNIKKSQFKQKLSNTNFSGLDRYDSEKVPLSERVKDTVDDIKYLATPGYTESSYADEFRKSIGNIEALSLKESERKELLEARDKANDNRGIRMSVSDLLAGKDAELEDQPYSDKYQKYVEGFNDDTIIDDVQNDVEDDIYRIDNRELDEVLMSADILTSPKSTRQERFFGASCLVIGHRFCHLASCQCSCHIEKVYRDKVPSPVIYAGYSVYRSLQQSKNEISSQMFEKLLVDASIFIMKFFDEYNIAYNDEKIEQGISILKNMSENDIWDQNEFISLFA